MDREQKSSDSRSRRGAPVDPHRGRSLSAQIGFYMWRGGLIFCACYATYRGVDWIIELVVELGIPLQVAFGVGFLVTGFLVLVSSLIVERVIDARAERGLKDL